VSTKNEPVGDAECPIKNCAESVPVYKYRGASSDPKRRRFEGRLYCVCPVHGRVENQEFLLERIKWRDGKNGEVATAKSEPASSATVKPTPQPTTTTVARRTTTTPPTSQPTPAPAPETEKPKKSSWFQEYE